MMNSPTVKNYFNEKVCAPTDQSPALSDVICAIPKHQRIRSSARDGVCFGTRLVPTVASYIIRARPRTIDHETQ